MKTCLVVDDSSVIRKVARRILEDLSFHDQRGGRWRRSPSQCQKAMPGAILLDWNMPVMDGLTLPSAQGTGRGNAGRRLLHH